MSRRHAVLSFVLALAIIAPATPAAAARSVDYAALGDSYAAGVGAPGSTGPCGRSPYGYPQLWADRHHPRTFRNAACGGATTDTVLMGQLWALNSGTDLVSISVGGNDAGFAPTVGTCLVTSDDACRTAVEVARTFIRYVLPDKLDKTYRAIGKRAPRAKIVVLTYPRLFATGSCPGGLSAAKRAALNSGADDLAAVTAARAAAARITFVDVRPPFEGHGICSATPWINGPTVARPGDSFHPNAAGYLEGYLPAFSTAAR